MTDLTEGQLAKLADTLGVQRNGMTDEQLFEACLRMIVRNMGAVL